MAKTMNTNANSVMLDLIMFVGCSKLRCFSLILVEWILAMTS